MFVQLHNDSLFILATIGTIFGNSDKISGTIYRFSFVKLEELENVKTSTILRPIKNQRRIIGSTKEIITENKIAISTKAESKGNTFII